MWRIIIAYSGFQIFAALTSWYARRAHEIAGQLRETNAHLVATRSLLEESARDHERLRLSRELHDVAGHKLTALKLNLTALQREANAPKVDTCGAVGRRNCCPTYAAWWRPSATAMAWISARRWRSWWRRSRAPRLHLEIAGDAGAWPRGAGRGGAARGAGRPDERRRHSQAHNLWVVLRRDGGQLRLDIRDDGRGQAAMAGGIGLGGMRERLAEIAGGWPSPAARAGVALDIQLPLQP